MLNMLTLVGRIVKQDKENEITVSCPRSEKNEQGVYETDLIDVKLQGCVWENISTYCKVGDIVGIKGKLEALDGQIIVKADKISFLSSKSDSKD